MNSKEPQKYILIEPTTLEDIQAWATDEAVERPLFKPFDENAIRKQITEEAKELLNGRVLLTSPFEDGGFNPSKEEMEQMDTDDILTFVDRVLALLGGTTNGK